METVNCICIGDPHFKKDNIPIVDLFIEKIVCLVTGQKPDFVVVLGDLMHEHERLLTPVLNKSYEFIKRISELTKVFVVVGNHDMINNQVYLTEDHWMNAMKYWDNVVIVDKVIKYTLKLRDFIFVPYVYVGRFHEALDTHLQKQLLHQSGHHPY